MTLTLFVIVVYWKPAMEEITALTKSQLSLTHLQIDEEPIQKGSTSHENRNSTDHQLQHQGNLSLSTQVINRVKKFMFFVGYQRSGHSIIGTLVDAHPHVVISNNLPFLKKFHYLQLEARHGNTTSSI